jgi:hypothetical protein
LALLAHGTITRQRVAGVWLYALAPAPVSASAKGRDERAGGTGFSVEAVAAYEASLADIDALLARLGGDGEDDQVSPPPIVEGIGLILRKTTGFRANLRRTRKTGLALLWIPHRARRAARGSVGKFEAKWEM